jgi:hypothetical protein
MCLQLLGLCQGDLRENSGFLGKTESFLGKVLTFGTFDPGRLCKGMTILQLPSW